MEVIGLPDKDESEGGVPPDTEYRRWLKTQPKEYAERVLKSYSPIVIGRSLDKFAEYQKAQQKPKVTQSTSLTRREQQLRSAVPARTAGVTHDGRSLSGFDGPWRLPAGTARPAPD